MSNVKTYYSYWSVSKRSSSLAETEPMAVSNWWESRQGRIFSEKSGAELSLIKGKGNL